MPTLEWLRASSSSHEDMLESCVAVCDGEAEVTVIAGAFKGKAFIPGVYDPKTWSCVIREDNIPEEDFYVLRKDSSLNLTWVSDRDGHAPIGSLQCGTHFHGEPLYIGRFRCDGRLLSGMVDQQLGGCSIKLLHRQFFSNHYEVLCLSSVPFGFTYSNVCPPASKMFPTSTPSSVNVVPYRSASLQKTPLSTPTSSSCEKTTIILRSNKRLFPPASTWNLLQRKRLMADKCTSDLIKKNHQKPRRNWQRAGSGYRLIRSPSKHTLSYAKNRIMEEDK